MPTPGDTFATFVREVWLPEIITTQYFNSSFFDPDTAIFEHKDPPAGTQITKAYTYDVTDNTETYNFDDPMPTPNSSSQISAAFNKTHYQTAIRIFGVYEDYFSTSGGETGDLDYARETVELQTKAHIDNIVGDIISDLISQIDSTGNYSDSARDRATYNFASYEFDASAGALTQAMLEDMLEALLDDDRGGSIEDYTLVMPLNQKTNLSRLGFGSGAGYAIKTVPLGNMDSGRFKTLETWNGIPILTIPEMDNGTILMVNASLVKMYKTRDFTLKEKSEAADTTLMHLTSAWDVVVHNPKMHGKISNLAA